jgi:hypothetical protein
MSIMTYNVIIVTSQIFDKLEKAHKLAHHYFGAATTAIYCSELNNVRSFAVMPHGYGAASPGAGYWEVQRQIYFRILRGKDFAFEDGSNSLRWVEVRYGESGVRRHPVPQVIDWNKTSDLNDE